jgi:hypothetical protein
MRLPRSRERPGLASLGRRAPACRRRHRIERQDGPPDFDTPTDGDAARRGAKGSRRGIGGAAVSGRRPLGRPPAITAVTRSRTDSDSSSRSRSSTSSGVTRPRAGVLPSSATNPSMSLSTRVSTVADSLYATRVVMDGLLVRGSRR